MLNLGSTYLIARDMKVSIEFYTKLLECEPKSKNINRWAEFHGPNYCIALFNPRFDIEEMKSGRSIVGKYNTSYLEYKKIPVRYGNNMVLNFWVEDLDYEYQRIIDLNIGKVSEILFINVVAPYYCFILNDPDENTIEITGKYSKEIDA